MKTTAEADPENSPERESSSPSGAKKVLAVIFKYLGAYLLGIILCILLTPVEAVLAGKALWPLYPIGALFGFFFYYFYLNPAYTTGSEITFWLFGAIGLVPILAEVLFRVRGNPALRVFRPCWIGLPIGFLGTMGAYYTAAASI